jgi:protein TonB
MHDHLASLSRFTRRHHAAALSLTVHLTVIGSLLWVWPSRQPQALADKPQVMVMLLGATNHASELALPAQPAPGSAAAKPRPAHPASARLRPTPKTQTALVAATQPAPHAAAAATPPTTAPASSAASAAAASASSSAASAAVLASTASAPRDAELSTPPPTEYLRRISRIISMSQKYPWSARQDGQQGDVIVRMHLARTGHVLAATLLRSSGVMALDMEARDVVLRIAQFPPFPNDYIPWIAEFDIDQPVSFRHYLN